MTKITKKRMEDAIEWILQILGYALILVFVATFFDTFQIDSEHLYFYGLVATLIIFILNKTIKPISQLPPIDCLTIIPHFNYTNHN